MGQDISGHPRVRDEGYNFAHGGFGYLRNEGGAAILYFSIAFNLMVANTHLEEERAFW